MLNLSQDLTIGQDNVPIWMFLFWCLFRFPESEINKSLLIHKYIIQITRNKVYLLVVSENAREFEMYNTFQNDGKIDLYNSSF